MNENDIPHADVSVQPMFAVRIEDACNELRTCDWYLSFRLTEKDVANGMDQLFPVPEIHEWHPERRGEQTVMRMRLECDRLCSNRLEIEVKSWNSRALICPRDLDNGRRG
jgi:hypothetical protein